MKRSWPLWNHRRNRKRTIVLCCRHRPMSDCICSNQDAILSLSVSSHWCSSVLCRSIRDVVSFVIYPICSFSGIISSNRLLLSVNELAINNKSLNQSSPCSQKWNCLPRLRFGFVFIQLGCKRSEKIRFLRLRTQLHRSAEQNVKQSSPSKRLTQPLFF